jgi:zinc and cadmium transporter
MLAAVVASALSVATPALLSLTLPAGPSKRVVSLSVGLMLATSLLHALPEAFDSGASARSLLATMLAGLMSFFLLEKASIVRLSYISGAIEPAVHHAAAQAGTRTIFLAGDGLHRFSDGVLIAAASLANPRLGMITVVAVLAHEIPQRIGGYLILLDKGFSHFSIISLSLVSSSLTLVGAAAGYFALDYVSELVPYVLVFSSTGFVYVALSDLIPQIQNRSTLSESLQQLVLIATGVSVVVCTTAQH